MLESPSRLTIINSAFSLATALALSSCASESEPRWTAAAPLEELASDFGVSDLAMDAGGNAIAVWAQRADRGLRSGDHTVSAARFTPGAGWGFPTRLGSSGKRGASQPALAVNAKGHAVAAWWEWASDSDDPAGEGVWAARFDPDTGWEDAVLVGEAGHSPSVALNDHGRAVMVWTRALDTVLASHLDPESGWGAPTRLDRDCLAVEQPEVGGLPNPSAAGSPKVAMNDSGHVVVVWDDNESETDELGPCGAFSLRASSYAPGVGWAPPTSIGIRSTAFGSLHAAVAVEESGRSLAGSLAGEVGSYNVAEGWSILDLGPGGGKSSVAMAESGEAIVVWEATSAEFDIYPAAVRAIRFSPELGWSEPETVSAPPLPSIAAAAAPKSPTILDSSGADVAVNDAGECIVVWHQVGLPTVRSPPFSVWTNRYAPELGWSGPITLSIAGADEAFLPRIAIDAQGRGIAIWTEAQGAFNSSDPGRLMWSRFE